MLFWLALTYRRVMLKYVRIITPGGRRGCVKENHFTLQKKFWWCHFNKQKWQGFETLLSSCAPLCFNKAFPDEDPGINYTTFKSFSTWLWASICWPEKGQRVVVWGSNPNHPNACFFTLCLFPFLRSQIEAVGICSETEGPRHQHSSKIITQMSPSQ